ncbi:hypothetical protein A3C21_02495 [Candidatus Kaiserbacteria bacterium RIFCSPHIGHO2_02_FULL_59_21]|uniref:Glycosyltransferase 2-like domain-containing protein n=1 Tax=Candidatus Kaiserbacteria bacterium RIFCSPHIGHO2_02_FULL_59_21 TaxID=1798500 RepID=A0A1F6E1S1_9BACT|nr:MAG: hypothetical protein A2766_02425 [Candidatus Kaiserbacteria bacterium RIFCSPHIGHO2_01_FULL_58_22]OGG67655.1 MAG: hypothetical protein A3C21_02495 [Candidatus Kaiserbacteria bacterium RIFCSPHIGHO2_02_FULL_59_21]OGG79031.1 MAG: hypothetical protein A2952_02925 [Candidatus Kaiserbacteria bacterium RIFCSPLOWO2_01_FULL_59_34]
MNIRSAETSATGRPDISVVVLCYKAGESVRALVARLEESLEARALSYELILVANYNASERAADPTPEIVKELASRDRRAVAVALEKEGMFGWDVRTGLVRASGDAIAYIDGDGQNPVEDVVRAYDALCAAHADMALTYRVKRHDGLQRIFISRAYNLLLRALFPRVSVHDANSKPKIFTREALSRLALSSDDWFIDAEIVIQAAYKNFAVAQIPTVFHKNLHRSSFVTARAVIVFLAELVQYRIRTWLNSGAQV